MEEVEFDEQPLYQQDMRAPESGGNVMFDNADLSDDGEGDKSSQEFTLTEETRRTSSKRFSASELNVRVATVIVAALIVVFSTMFGIPKIVVTIVAVVVVAALAVYKSQSLVMQSLGIDLLSEIKELCLPLLNLLNF